MSSMFSFFRGGSKAERRTATATAAATKPSVSFAAAPRAARTRANVLSADSTATLNQASAALLAALDDFLPAPVGADVPAPVVSLVSMNEKQVGIGRRRGVEPVGDFPVVELKGLRLDAVIRFELWAVAPNDVETAVASLHAKLLTERETLRGLGFLVFTLASISTAEHVAVASAWRKYADYRVLFEFHFADTDGAGGLIARIPIASDLEVTNSPQRETTTVTDEMVRWDDLDPVATLAVTGPAQIFRLSLLHFVENTMPGGSVRLRRTFDHAAGTPTSYATLDDFFDAVTDAEAPDRHAEIVLSLDAFVTAFDDAGEAITLSDAPQKTDPPRKYEALAFAIAPALQLPNVRDRFEISYENAASGHHFDHVAVFYLRAGRG